MVALTLLILLLACGLVLQARFFLKREEDWRKREMELVNRLLKTAQVQPLTIERERVIKLPDPELPPLSPVDQAFFQDDIKEELEQVFPEAARMSHSMAQHRFPREWRAIEQRLQAERLPLRAD